MQFTLYSEAPFAKDKCYMSAKFNCSVTRLGID